MVMIMLSIASLFPLVTPDRSIVFVSHVFASAIVGVSSVVVPPLSCNPILILLPVLDA